MQHVHTAYSIDYHILYYSIIFLYSEQPDFVKEVLYDEISIVFPKLFDSVSKVIAAAYETLRDPERRRLAILGRYDILLWFQDSGGSKIAC